MKFLGDNILKSQLDWKVEGKTKNGKMVVAEYKGNRVYFKTLKNSDHIEYMALETYLVTSNGKRIILAETMYSDVLKEFSKMF